MNRLQKLVYFLREYFFPAGCVVCGAALHSPPETWYGLCGACEKNLRASLKAETARCDICGRPLVSETARCMPCRQKTEIAPPDCDRIVSLFPYLGNYVNLLTAFKYDRSLGAGNFFAEMTVKALALFPELENFEKPVLVPVPPRPGKIRKTGWDQIAALAKQIRAMFNVPPIDACLIRLATQTQKKLDKKDRQANLKGRIIATRKAPRVCVVFDDVQTTGATINACAAALKKAGAEKVFGVCLFYD